MSKKKRGGEEKKERENKKTKTKQTNSKHAKNTCSSLDLTDPNFAFWENCFTILLESFKNQPI